MDQVLCCQSEKSKVSEDEYLDARKVGKGGDAEVFPSIKEELEALETF